MFWYNRLEFRSYFLDLSKVFDKVWHEGIIFKLKQNGTSGELPHILSDFLSKRKQSVVLNGQSSTEIYSRSIIFLNLYK